MCGRFAAEYEEKRLTKYARPGQHLITTNPEKKFDARPSEPHTVLVHHQGENYITTMTWGWQRSWSAKLLINAQMESLSSRSTWREAANRQRCLIPASGWWEWRDQAGEKRLYFHRPHTADLLFLGGLYEQANTGYRFLIITRPSVGSLRDIHPRMPLLIHENNLDRWLFPDLPLASVHSFAEDIQRLPIELLACDQLRSMSAIPSVPEGANTLIP